MGYWAQTHWLPGVRKWLFDFTIMDRKNVMVCNFFFFMVSLMRILTVILWFHGEFVQNLWSLIVEFMTCYGEDVLFYLVENKKHP